MKKPFRTRLELPTAVIVTTTLLSGCIYVNETPECQAVVSDAGVTTTHCRVSDRGGSCIEVRNAAGQVLETVCVSASGTLVIPGDGGDARFSPA